MALKMASLMYLNFTPGMLHEPIPSIDIMVHNSRNELSANCWLAAQLYDDMLLVPIKKVPAAACNQIEGSCRCMNYIQ